MTLSAIRVVVLFLAVASLSTRLVLKEYLLERVVPSCANQVHALPECSPQDVTTTDPHELVARDGTSALQKLNEHGVTFLEDLLTRDQSQRLRRFILTENRNPSRPQWFVTEPQHRHHLSFGLHEEPEVTQAIHALLSAEVVRKALSVHLGRGRGLAGVALMELASITSYAGAQGQDFHKDVNPSRRGIDMVSLFVNLQDTTLAQGPTAFCPGTQMCHGDDTFCDDWNTTVWATTRAGTAALMDSHLYHRGSDHTDTNDDNNDETARVLFYMTFAVAPPTPNHKIPPEGSTYALRHDLWGQTAQQVWQATAPTALATQMAAAAAEAHDNNHHLWIRIGFSGWMALNRLKHLVTSYTGLQWSFPPQPRGWTLVEVSSVKWTDDDERDDIDAWIVHCTTVALWCFVLYAVTAEWKIWRRDQQQRGRRPSFREDGPGRSSSSSLSTEDDDSTDDNDTPKNSPSRCPTTSKKYD